MPTTKMHHATTPPAACSSAVISATLLVTLLLVRLPEINGKAVTHHCLHKNLRLKREEAVCQGECFDVFIVEFDNWTPRSSTGISVQAKPSASAVCHR